MEDNRRQGAIVRFAILMQWGRVGSNLMVNIISQSKIARMANERFNVVKDLRDQIRFYEEHFEIGADVHHHPLLGMKENVLSLADREVFKRLFLRDGVRVVRMRRDNLVKAAVSQIRAVEFAEKSKAETGKAQWAVRKDASPLGPSYVDVPILMQRITMMARARAELVRLFQPSDVLDIEYEEVLHDLPALVAKVRHFLDIPHHREFRVPFQKATPDSLEETIRNFEEVRSALQGTQYADMLEA